MRQPLDPQNEIFRFRQNFFKKHPGLEQYLRQEKALLFALMLLVAAHKLSVLFAAGAGLTFMGLLGAVVGVGIPAIVALAAYSGRWRSGLLFFLLGGFLAYDLYDFCSATLPRLKSGSLVLTGSPVWLYCLAVTESLCMILFFAAAVWLTVPRKNREWAGLASRMNIECSRIARQASAGQPD